MSAGRHALTAVFIKTFVAMLALVIPLYATTILVSLQGQREVLEWYRGAAESRLSFLLDTIEGEIEDAAVNLAGIVTSSDIALVKRYGVGEIDYRLTAALNALQSDLARITENNDYVTESVLLLPNVGRELTARWIRPLDEPWWNTVRGMVSRESGGFYTRDGEVYLALTPQFRGFGADEGGANYGVYSILDGDALADTLARNVNPTSGDLYLSFDGSVVIGPDGLVDRSVTVPTASDRFTLAVSSQSFPLSLVLVLNPEALGRQQAPFLVWVAVSSVGTLGLLVLFSVTLRRSVDRPLHFLVEAFGQVEQGDLDVQVPARSRDEFGYLIERFNEMVRRLRETIERMYAEQLHAKDAELKQLEYQINPHFLYNSFFTLYRMAQAEDHEAVRDFSLHLGRYYEYITRGGGQDATLGTEYQHCRTYLQIQKLRFEKRVIVEVPDLPPELESFPLPRLILQPVLENAFEHGLRDTLEGGRIEVAVGFEHGTLQIHVSDNGVGIDSERLQELTAAFELRLVPRETTGLVNCHRRLRIRFGRNSGLRLGRNESGGTTCTITVAMDQPGDEGALPPEQ